MKQFLTLILLLLSLLGCIAAIAEEEKQLNIYNWSDYIRPESLAQFEKQIGIKVQYDTFDSNELLESKLLAGKTGYDIVVPTAEPFLARQIKMGIYQPIDKAKIKDYTNLDPFILNLLAASDPGNTYSIPWMWGTIGIGYNLKKIKEIMPDAPVDSLRMIFDPKIAAKFAKCGIEILDSPTEIIPHVLLYLGLDPNSQKKEDLEKAEQILLAVRPYIRQFHGSKYINDLANGDICLAFGNSGDLIQAANRAKEAKRGVEIKYIIPKEGALVWIDAIAIPKDAPHPENALKFINFILAPEVAAAVTNYVGFANANKASLPYLHKEVRENPGIYPDPETMKRLFTLKPTEHKYDRQRTAVWMHVLSGG